MLELSLNELKLIAKSRGIKGSKSMSKERLLSVLSEPKLAESEENFDNERFKKIKKDFNELRNRFSKPQIKEIRRSLYDIKNQKNLSKSKIKRIEKNLLELEETPSRFKKYENRDYDGHKYRGIRDVGNLVNEIAFSHSIDEDYYKPIKTKSVFNGNYIEYESKGDKDKKLLPEKYLDMIRPYLSDIINNHKTIKNLRVHSRNEVIDYETQCGEWKIQLTMSINFISSKDSDETCNMQTKSDNIEIMMCSATNDIIE